MADAKPIKLRHGVTNNPRRIVGVDGRTSNARRFSDILTALSVEYLGLDPVALRELAGLKLTAEMCRTSVIEGDRKARSDLVRVSNLIARRESQLRAANAKANVASTPDPAEYLATKAVGA